MKRIAIIPSYEPGETLPALTAALDSAGFEIIVIDDGSSESFSAVFNACKKHSVVLRHEVNCGKGRAMKTAYTYILEHFDNDCVIVTLDCDGQHSIEDAVAVCAEAAKHKDALVLGCRAFGADVPPRSRMGNAITRLVYSIVSGVKLSDTQTGLRAFSYDMISFLLSVEGERYEYEMNVLMECPRRGIAMREVPISTIYHDNNSGSHFHTVRDSFRIYRDIFKFVASSLASFCVDYVMYLLFIALYGFLGDMSVPIANVCARIISATFNFTVNKKIVFKNTDSVLKTGSQYFILALFILVGNTIVLSLLANVLGVNKYLAKILTECIFFLISWCAQRMIIFRHSSK